MILLRTMIDGLTLRSDIIINCQILMSARVKMHWIQSVKYRAANTKKMIAATTTTRPPKPTNDESKSANNMTVNFPSKGRRASSHPGAPANGVEPSSDYRFTPVRQQVQGRSAS